MDTYTKEFTMRTLRIKNLHTSVEDVEILKGVDLEIRTGEVHVIMGPNGTGKSTLASTIMGHYKYRVTEGEILLDDEDVLAMSVDESSRKAYFLPQYPYEIPELQIPTSLRRRCIRLNEGEHISHLNHQEWKTPSRI